MRISKQIIAIIIMYYFKGISDYLLYTERNIQYI